MHFLRTFGLLLLLVMSNAGIAFEYGKSLPDVKAEQIDFQFSEDHQNLFESTLITPVEVQSNRTLIPAAFVPEQYGLHRISQENYYIVYSRTIIPSLDIAAIIFPFHSFL